MRNNINSKVFSMLDVMVSDKILNRSYTISVTGYLGVSRTEFATFIERCGGRFENSVTYHTKYLVTNNDWNQNTTISPKASIKLEKAKQLGCIIITESDFYKLLAEKASEAGDQHV